MADAVVVLASPKRFHYWVFVVPVSGGTEHFVGVLVAVVAVAVAAVLVIIGHCFVSPVFLSVKRRYA